MSSIIMQSLIFIKFVTPEKILVLQFLTSPNTWTKTMLIFSLEYTPVIQIMLCKIFLMYVTTKQCLNYRGQEPKTHKLQFIFLIHLLSLPHLSLNHVGHWGITDNFTTSFFHFFLFFTALWDKANSRPVQFLMSSFSVCFVFFPLSLARCFWPDLMNGRHVHTISVCISFWWSSLRVVQLPAESWHTLPHS